MSDGPNRLVMANLFLWIVIGQWLMNRYIDLLASRDVDWNAPLFVG